MEAGRETLGAKEVRFVAEEPARARAFSSELGRGRIDGKFI